MGRARATSVRARATPGAIRRRRAPPAQTVRASTTGRESRQLPVAPGAAVAASNAARNAAVRRRVARDPCADYSHRGQILARVGGCTGLQGHALFAAPSVHSLGKRIVQIAANTVVTLSYKLFSASGELIEETSAP